MRLASVILLGAVTSAGGATLASGWGHVQAMQRTLVGEVEARSLSLARTIADVLETEVRHNLDGIEDLADLVDAGAAELTPASVTPLLASWMARRDDWGALCVVGSTLGVSLAAVTADRRPLAVGVNYSDRDYFQDLMRTGRGVMSHAQVGKKTGRVTVHFGAPVAQPPRAYVATAMSLARFDARARRAIASVPEARAVVWDERGHIVIDTARESLRELTVLPPDHLFAPARSDGEVRRGTDEKGRPVLGAASHAQLGTQRWSILVVQTETSAFAAARGARADTITATVLALGLGLILASVISRFIASPIEQLARAVRIIRPEHANATHDIRISGPCPQEARDLEGAIRQLVERLGGHAAELDARVRERTRELEQARDMALDAARTKSRFVTNMSHELRTPMNGILGSLQLLLEASETPEQHQLTELAQTAGHRLSRTLEDLLEFSAFESGSTDLAELPFEPRGLVEAVLEEHARPAERAGLVLRANIDLSRELTLLGDPSRLSRVFGKLLDNAIRFTKRGWVQVTATASVEDGVAEVVYTVTDTGPGVPLNRRSDIFEPFAQADASMSRRHEGVGLGLPLARRSARSMGGDVSLEATGPEGSRFVARVHLPCAERPGTETLLAKKRGLSRPHILAVDDNPVNLQIIARILERLGQEVDTAVNGQEAVQKVERETPSLILMDCQMPEMDGFEATRKIRALGGPAASIPIVALTANVSAEEVRACLDAGMNDHLGKPASRKRIQAALHRWLG
ncbi:MAG: response regulator [Myxococcota bacterium]